MKFICIAYMADFSSRSHSPTPIWPTT